MYHFIVNPKSSSGAGLKKWTQMERILKEKHIPYQVSFTKKSGDATRLAKKITSSGKDHILTAVGGDGTANEVVGGIVDFSHTTFAYIPTGSSNDLARALSLPANPEQAMQLVLSPKKIRRVNVGEVAARGKSRRFLVSSGIGFDAAVCHQALSSPIKNTLNRFHLGKLTYLGIALRQIFTLKGEPVVLQLDEGNPISFPKVFFSAFMNTGYEGGGFLFCPDADPEDDLLDICLVERVVPLRIVRLLPLAFLGRHTSAKEVHIYRCRQANIKTLHPLAVHTDGESFEFQTELSIRLLDEKLSFITG